MVCYYAHLLPAGLQQTLDSIQDKLKLFIDAGSKPALQRMSQSVKFTKFRPPPGSRFTRVPRLRRIEHLIACFR